MGLLLEKQFSASATEIPSDRESQKEKTTPGDIEEDTLCSTTDRDMDREPWGSCPLNNYKDVAAFQPCGVSWRSYGRGEHANMVAQQL